MEVGPHYQDRLANVIRQEKPAVVIETGLYKGVGAEYILKALDDNNRGQLISIDPSPHADYWSSEITHPRFRHIPEKSQDALPLLRETPDFFIHDSDHSYECQSFEYEWAWAHVPTGGIIASDDPFWGIPPHLAWDHFLARHGVTQRNICGNAQWIRKP